jgi:hypothetical protein
MNPVLEALFGNRTAACVMLFLQCYGEGHAQRIAKTFDFGLNMTQRQLKRLEEHGVLVSRRLGNMRLFISMNAIPLCATCASFWRRNWLHCRKTISSSTFGRGSVPGRAISRW